MRNVKGDVEAATNEIGYFFKRLHEVLAVGGSRISRSFRMLKELHVL